MSLNSKLYDVLKPIALIWLPALATLYFALAAIWGIPDAQNVVGTLSAVDAFLGAVLGISSNGYKANSDGNLVIDKSDPAKDVYSLQLSTPFDEIDGKKSITLQVTPTSASAAK